MKSYGSVAHACTCLIHRAGSLVEVKADFQIEDAVVLAKQRSAEQMAAASSMEYLMVKATEANRGI